MLRMLALAALVATAFTAMPGRAQAQDPATALHALFDAEWERGMVESPENASINGDNRFNDRWSDNSLAAIAKRQAEDRAALDALHAIDRARLSPADQLNYDTFEWLQQRAVERQKFKEYLQPVNHQGGVQTADGLAEYLPFATTKDYRDWLERMDAIPTVVDQTIALMREGGKTGNTPPKVLMQRVPAQIAAQIVDDPSKSPFYRPFLKFRDSVPAADRPALQAEAQRIIREKIVPAYRTFAAFVDEDYLPKSRDSIAATALPDGKAYYDFLARYYTTTDLTAEQIHAIGLKEVARLRAEMEQVKAATGFKGTLAEFFTYLRTDPRFFEKTPEGLLERYRATAKRIDPELVKAFRTIPREPYGVRPIPDNVAPDTTTAYYQPGSNDGSRPGYYYVNLYKPDVRPTWEMMPLTLHEAVPGHHFQFARGLELPDAPMFRRTAYFVGYSEGWGLYAERLGYDMGLYDDPYDHFGQLTYEMWRAVRLVVDTGMHSMGWSRQQAIDYFKANCAKTDQDIVNEVDRYLGTPGQALAYKIGQLKILELRERARQALGPDFDVRDYDDAVLETGSVPLAALEKHIDAWIATRKAAAGQKAGTH
ncbi:MAG TPA: DUF885 domain-containing protein [Xanthomonadaceae bacterium]|nr:DUF885 domain-containing protein [Xanthomonadaceae bacterium]